MRTLSSKFVHFLFHCLSLFTVFWFQAANVLGNLSNSTEQYSSSVIFAALPGSPILSAIRTAITEHSNPDVRRPLMFAISSFADLDHRQRKDMLDAGIGGTLRRISEWGGKAPGIPGSRTAITDDKEVVELARIALDKLEHGGEMWA